MIRRLAQVGDLVEVKARGEHVIFAMQVASEPRFAEYWRDPRFTNKRPDWSRATS